MRNLVQRGNIYYIKKRINGKQIFKSLETSDRRLAMERLERYMDELINARLLGKDELPLPRTKKQILADEPPSTLNISQASLSQALTEYVHTYQSSEYAYSAGTIKTKNKFSSMLRGYEWNIFTNPPKFQEFLKEIRLKYRYGNSYLYKLFNQQLKPFLDFCIRQNYYTEHQKKRLDFPKQPKSKIQRNVFLDTDFLRLLNYLKKKEDFDFMLYVILIYQFGNRLNELPQLKHSAFNFADNSITIPSSKRQKVKVLTFSSEFRKIITPLLNRAKTHSPYIFYGNDKSAPYYSNRFKKIRGLLNLNKNYTLRDFRYTAGVQHLEQTKDIYQVMGLLGQGQIATTQKSYLPNIKSTQTAILDGKISAQNTASFSFFGENALLGDAEFTKNLPLYQQKNILLGAIFYRFMIYLFEKYTIVLKDTYLSDDVPYDPYSFQNHKEEADGSIDYYNGGTGQPCLYTLSKMFPDIQKLWDEPFYSYHSHHYSWYTVIVLEAHYVEGEYPNDSPVLSERITDIWDEFLRQAPPPK